MLNRRELLKMGVTLTALQSAHLATGSDDTRAAGIIYRTIPSSGERIPAIGMGTSRTFDTTGEPATISHLTQLMNTLLSGGGSVIDSSPMYGTAETRVGDVLKALPERPELFVATKVWTTGKDAGIAQMHESAKRMNVTRFDLIAIHNLKDWRTHLKTLSAWKKEGRVRYIGITTSHGRDHEELADIMRSQPLDFVQFSYNIEDRAAEQTLLPLALERGIATMVNRPYQRGSLFNRSRGKPLPGIARDLDCDSWGQFYLKFILGHPGVTSVIPATSKLHHMVDNMKANHGRVPDKQQRDQMLDIYQAL